MRSARGWRRAGIAVLVVLALLAAARLALEPLVARETRNALHHLDGMWGDFDRVQVSVLDLSYRLYGLRIDRVAPGGLRQRYARAAMLEAGLYWRELLHGKAVGALLLGRPELELHAYGDHDPFDRSRRKKAPADLPVDLGRLLQGFVPFRLDRAEARRGELVWIDEQVKERPSIRLHEIEGTLENFATRAALARGEPSVLALSATLQDSGKVSIFVSADPLAKGLTFAGQARVEGLELAQLNGFLAAAGGVKAEHGTLDLNAVFKSVDGHLSGGVRPILRHADVGQAKPGIGNKLKAALADLSIKVLSDRVPGRDAVATTVPIEGDVTNPDTKLWPTVISIVRNAFVAGLSDSMANLPPKEAHQGESPQAQARRPPATQRAPPGTTAAKEGGAAR